MRIGVMIGATGNDPSIEATIQTAKDLEARGFDNLWLANIFGLDAITTLALIGRETERIELGTAVVPTYPRHPVAMAQQSLTTNAASGGRFHLGIGLSHQMVIEGMFGMSYEKPARHMREYLEVLTPLLQGAQTSYAGELYNVNATFNVPGATAPPVLVAALGDVMLKVAGRLSDGTITWMTGFETIENHIGPKLRTAASDAGRPDPRIVAGIPIALTDDPDAARAWVAKNLAMYGMIPSYRAMLDKEGAEGPADIAIVGGEAELDASIKRLHEIGVTDFDAWVIPVTPDAETRTLDYLAAKVG